MLTGYKVYRGGTQIGTATSVDATGNVSAQSDPASVTTVAFSVPSGVSQPQLTEHPLVDAPARPPRGRAFGPRTGDLGRAVRLVIWLSGHRISRWRVGGDREIVALLFSPDDQRRGR